MRRIEASDAFSELLQHELDHLDGVLAIDRAIDANSFCTREEYQRRLLDKTRLYDGVAEILKAPPGLRAVLTNKPGGFARQILRGLGAKS